MRTQITITNLSGQNIVNLKIGEQSFNLFPQSEREEAVTRTERLRGAIERLLDAARKDEAVRFAEWLPIHAWEHDMREQRRHTTEELFQLFKQQQ